MNKKFFIALIAVVFFGLVHTASADIFQDNSSYLVPSVPYTYIANTFQSLGRGLVGNLTNIQLRARSPYYSNELTFFLLRCDRYPWGFDVNLWDFGCADVAGTFNVQPNADGYINQPLNLSLDPQKYYALFFYQGWQIYGSTKWWSYEDGEMGSYGLPNNYDNVGELQDAYFNLSGVHTVKAIRESL